MEIPQRENSFKSYRIAGGKIAIGREQDGTLEELTAISGHLLRIGYHEETYDGEDAAYLECDLELSDGTKCRVKSKVGLGGQSSQVAPVGLALGLLDCKLHDDIAIFPKKSAKPDPKYGKYSTYVNVGRVNPTSGQYKDIGLPREDFAGETSKQKWTFILDAVKKHECYAPRPAMEDKNADVDLSIFPTIAQEKRWPDPFGKAEAAYLTEFSEMEGRAITNYSQLSAKAIALFSDAYSDTFADVPDFLVPFMTEANAVHEKKAAKAFGKAS